MKNGKGRKRLRLKTKIAEKGDDFRRSQYSKVEFALSMGATPQVMPQSWLQRDGMQDKSQWWPAI